MSPATIWNPQVYAKSARFVSDLGEPLLELLALRPGEAVLDLGCGDGALTEKLVAAGAAVFGGDASFAQVTAARRRGIEALVLDGHRLCFKRCFDAVFSNAVLHWLKHPEEVLAGVGASLKSGGRFVGEFGGKGNVATIRGVLHAGLARRGIDPWSVDPWYYPDPDEYSALLTGLGFLVEYIELLPRPTRLPGDILGWLEMFAQPFSGALPPGEREKYLAEVRAELLPELCSADGVWHADYRRLRFRALRP